MGQGYIAADGTYVEGDALFARLLRREELPDNHPDFAETLASTGARPVWYGLTGSELVREAFGSFADMSNWKNFLAGAASYPIDIGWFGYGIAAATGAVGLSAQGRVLATGNRVWQVCEEAYAIGTSGPAGINKLAFMGSVYLNYLITGGAYAAFGRWRGGQFTQIGMALLLARGIASTAVSIEESPWFKWAMFGVVTAGSVVRIGEKFHDKLGSVDNLNLMDFIVSASTGEDDPDRIRGILGSTASDLASRLTELELDYPRDAEQRQGYSFGDEIPDYIRTEIWKTRSEISELSLSIRYSYYQSDEFYDQLIRAHNLCVRLKRSGVEHPTIDYFVKLADPTILHFVRMLFFSVANVTKHMNATNMALLREYDFWSLLKAEWEVGDNINNPDYVLPGN